MRKNISTHFAVLVTSMIFILAYMITEVKWPVLSGINQLLTTTAVAICITLFTSLVVAIVLYIVTTHDKRSKAKNKLKCNIDHEKDKYGDFR